MTPQSLPSAGKRSLILQGCIFGLFVLFVAQIVAGILMEPAYAASATKAYPDVQAMQGNGFAILRGFHYWSSCLLIAGSGGALFWMLLARRYEARAWLAVILLFGSGLLSQITGNLLPFDRHGVETAVVEAGVARQTPIVGEYIQTAILGGGQFNDTTIARWHLAHIGASVLGLAAIALFWSEGRKVARNKAVQWAPIAIAGLLALMAKAPLGHQATSADYGSYDAQVSWYTWPLHGSLNLWHSLSPGLGWVGSMVIPGILALFVVTIPWTSRRLSPKAIQVTFAVFAGYLLVAGIGFGGRFAPLVGNRDPLSAAPVAIDPAQLGHYDKALYAQGQKLFNSESCSGCHGENGQQGSVGPNLLGVAKRHGVDPTWYQKFIRDPASVKPNTMMPPSHDLTADQTRAIAEFLIHQK